jgi:hypothetical protein
MDEGLKVTLVVVALCSYLSVRVWVKARQREREAFYRAEAIKRIAEMGGSVPESVLSMLRAALQPPTIAWNPEGYRSAVVRSLAEKPDGAAAVHEFLREEERREALQWVGFCQLGGLITVGAGVGLMVFLGFLNESEPVYLVGLIPFLVGLAMLGYIRLAASRKETTK